MRALVALLVLANLLFLALARDWLAPVLTLSSAHEREPQRLAAQLNPQQVRVVAPDVASAAIAAAASAASAAAPASSARP